MGRYIFSLIFSIAAVLSLRSQWVQVPSGVSDSLTAITAVEGAFYVAGKTGTFLRSFDMGLTFTPTPGYDPGIVPGEESKGFTQLSFFDSLHGFGSSDIGSPVQPQVTYDGGITWNTSNHLGQIVVAINDSDAISFRGGPAITYSYPEGLLQEELFPIVVDIDSMCPPPPGLNTCFFYIYNGDTVGFTVGSTSWALASGDRLTTYYAGNYFNSWHVKRANIIAGDTVIFRSWISELYTSFDKGGTWSYTGIYPFDPFSNSGMHWIYSNLGFTVGPNGQIAQTSNGGIGWNIIPTPTTEHLNDIHFINDQQGWAVGENGTIIGTNDGGQTWFLENSGVTDHLSAIASDDQAVIIIGHNGTILRRDLTVSVPEASDANQISIMIVDPSGKRLRITSDLPIANVQLLDVTGRLLVDEKVNGTNSYSVSVPAGGIFVCTVRSGDGSQVSQRIFVP